MRRFLWLSLGVLLLASIAVASSGGATQAEARWVITDLGVLPGDDWSDAFAINDQGQIVGSSGGERPTARPFLWQDGKMSRLRSLDGASDLNERGQVAGAITVSGQGRAALWEKGRARNLGTVSGKPCWSGGASRLNDRGQVIGPYYTCRRDDRRGFLWDKGKMIDLGDLGVPNTHPIAINNRGQIVGWGYAVNERGNWENHGFLWEYGGMIDLGPIRADMSDEIALNDRGQVVFTQRGRVVLLDQGDTRTLPALGKNRNASANDITERGTIVGACEVKGGVAHPCMWQDGTARDLGTVFGDRGRALAANDRGQVVGFTMQPGEGEHAFVWENGRMTDLGMLPGAKRSWAFAINNRGQILGSSWPKAYEGEQHAVLWTLKP